MRALPLAACVLVLLAVPEASAATLGPVPATVASCDEDLSGILGSARRARLDTGTELYTWTRAGTGGSTSARPLRAAVVLATAGESLLEARLAALPKVSEPSDAFGDEGLVALVNGDVFDDFANDASVPRAPVLIDGEVAYAPPGSARVVHWWGERIHAARTMVRADAVFGSGETRFRLGVAAVNHYSLGAGPVMYTSAWHGRTPRGAHTLTIEGGRLVRWDHPGRRARPSADRIVIQVPPGTGVPHLPVGQQTRVRARLDGLHPQGDAMGFGARILRRGEIVAECTAAAASLRPRTALGWNGSGDRWLVTVTSGIEQAGGGMRRGGAAVPAVARWLGTLGATDAVLMDGGGSTVMLTRRAAAAPGSPPRRQDLPDGTYERPIPVAVVLVARAAPVTPSGSSPRGRMGP